MINLKIFEIISTFSENDWNNFILDVKSSDVTSGRKYLPLVMELWNFRTRLPELKKISASELFGTAYKMTFNVRTISTRQCELLKLLKKFLENNSYNKKEILGTYLFYDELISRNLQNIFSTEYKKKKDLLENNYFNDDSYHILSKIILKKHNFFELLNDKNKSADAFFEHSRVLLADILSNLYETGHTLLIYKYYNIKSEFDPMLELIDSISSEKYFEELEKQKEPIFIIPLIRYYIFKSFQHPNCKKYILKATRIYFANEKQFTNDFKLRVYGMFMSYYFVKINNGELKYFKNQFVLCKKKLKQNLVSDMMEHSSSNASIFREYIVTGLHVKQYKWVEMVIKKYSPMLPEDIREDEYALALVKLNFAKKEYQKVIEITDSFKIKNTIHYLDSVGLKLMSLYELKKYEECYLAIDRTKHFIINNKAKTSGIAYSLEQYQDFIDIFSKLLNFRTNPFNKDINNLLYDMEKSNSLAKNWIIGKIKIILGNNKI